LQCQHTFVFAPVLSAEWLSRSLRPAKCAFSRGTAAYTTGKGPVRSVRMYTLHLTVSQGSAPVWKASAGPCLRCPPSTSGRPFGSSPSVDRNHSRPGPSTEGVLQTLPAMVRSAQRSVRLEAVRGNKQEKTNKSSEQPAVSHWLLFCRRTCFYCFNYHACLFS